MSDQILMALIGIITSLATVSLYLVKAISKKTEVLSEDSKKTSHEAVFAIETIMKNHSDRIESLNTKVNKLIDKVDDLKAMSIENKQKLSSAFDDMMAIDKAITKLAEQIEKINDRTIKDFDKIKTEVLELRQDVFMVKTKKNN